MSIYIRQTHVLYTDQNFIDTLQRSKIWRERETNSLTIKNLEDFGKEMGYNFFTELKPNVYYADGEIIDVTNNKPLTTENQLKDYYTSKIINAVNQFGPTNYKIPTQKTKHFSGILLLKQLKNIADSESKRYQKYRNPDYKDLSLLTTRPQPQFQNDDLIPRLHTLTPLQMQTFVKILDRSENHGSKHTHRLTTQMQSLLLAFFGCSPRIIQIFEKTSNNYYNKLGSVLSHDFQIFTQNSKPNLSNQIITELLDFILGDLKFDKDYHESNVPSELQTVRKTIRTFMLTIGYNNDWVSKSFTTKLDKALSNKKHIKTHQEVKQDINQRDGRYEFSW